MHEHSPDGRIRTSDLWESELGQDLLTRDEETALARRAYRGDLDAARELCERNLGLAMFWARKYGFSYESFDDLRQVGAIALFKAARQFNPDHGAKFGTYASKAIQNAISRHRQAMRPSGFTDDEVSAGLGYLSRTATPRADELAAQTEMSVVDAQALIDALQPLSLDAPVRGQGDGGSMGEFVASVDARLDAVAERDEHRRVLRQMLGLLPTNEAKVLCLRYGVATTHARTIEETASELGISQGSVRLLERQAMDRLQGRRDPRPPRNATVAVSHHTVRS